MAAKKVGPTGRVIGIDMTPDMLNKARLNAARLNVTNVVFRQGYIDREQLQARGQAMKKNEYGQYLLRLLED